jgi:hypothetical protein
MHAREFEMVAGSTLTIGPDERWRLGSVIERPGHTRTPDVKDEMPEFKNAMRWPSVEDITARAPLPPGYSYQYLDRQQVLSLIAALSEPPRLFRRPLWLSHAATADSVGAR